MKHLSACLVLAGLAVGAQAQAIYRPLLRPGVTYQFAEAGTPGDTVHTVRMNYNLSGPTYPDSLGRFNGRAVRIATRGASSCGGWTVRPDGLFGATVTIGFARHEYLLRAANGRTLLLKTQAPLNQAWTATAAGLTASITAKGVGTVLGQTDSITTITFSDGQTLLLGKQLGFIEGPALGSYLNGQRARRLTLTGMTVAGRWRGQPAVGPMAVFDFQPGDVFLRYSRQTATQGGNTCSESWLRDSVTTRTLNGRGDSIRYTIAQRILTRRYGFPGAPNGFCQNTPGTTLGPVSTYTMAVSANDETPLALLTNTLSGAGPSPFRTLTLAGARTTNYNGRRTQQVMARQLCPTPLPPNPSDSTQVSEIIDNPSWGTYVAGVGLVSSYAGGIYYDSNTTLLGYRKVNLPTSTGIETWGTLRTFAAILKTTEFRPAASTAAFPNPFGQELTVRFEAERTQPVTVQLRNALGQLVHAETRTVGAGPRQLPLLLPALPAGLYTLHLTADGRTQVLRVAKEQ